MKFSPDDLKKYYSGKYDKWIFAQNGKGEWVGRLDKEYGVICSKLDANDKEIPDIKIRKPVSTGGYGLNIFSQGIKSMFKRDK